MSKTIKKIIPSKDELLFLPLGGCNEIGMNLNLYGHDGEWLMVDCGVSFDNNRNGVDVLLPNPEFIAQHKKKLAGLVLTHAHEDHVGAVAHLWRQFECPVYATPFTMQVLKHKLTEAKLLDKVLLHEIGLTERFTVGNFDIELITLTHSIPEPNALLIRTGAGAVLHSGDWKFDDDPVVGEVSDEAALRKAGEEGVLAMLCDSTNVFVEGNSESERLIGDNLAKLIGDLSGRVIVTCFASNVARLHSLFTAGQKSGRIVALAGKAMHRMVQYAKDTGYIGDVEFLDAEEEKSIGDDVLVLCTGSQGEPLAALPRIARGDHPNIKISHKDTVIFSSRTIPGNEISIGALQNKLVRAGATVIGDNTEAHGLLHASGHPQVDELVKMYQFIKPQIAIPVHGEPRHLQAHAELARACQVPHSYVTENGEVLRLSQSGVTKIADVEAETLCFDGTAFVPLSAESLGERRMLATEGAMFCSVVVENHQLLGIQVSLKGVASQALPNGESDDEVAYLEKQAEDAFYKASKGKGGDIAEAIRIALRRMARKRYGKNTPVIVHFCDI